MVAQLVIELCVGAASIEQRAKTDEKRREHGRQPVRRIKPSAC